jgi:hypothetical protein
MGCGDLPKSGRPLTHDQEARARLIALACTRPPDTEEGVRRERWTYRELGEQVGMSESQAHAILTAADLRLAPSGSRGGCSQRASRTRDHLSPPRSRLRRIRISRNCQMSPGVMQIKSACANGSSPPS